MTDITNVLFIYNFNKKQKKHLPCVLIEHKVISHHTVFLLLLPDRAQTFPLLHVLSREVFSAAPWVLENSHLEHVALLFLCTGPLTGTSESNKIMGSLPHTPPCRTLILPCQAFINP